MSVLFTVYCVSFSCLCIEVKSSIHCKVSVVDTCKQTMSDMYHVDGQPC